ncbi:MAG: acyltransferase [Lentisphaerae bacterium]|nr:acyltransferase [Lentisphaerota bacterium]
MSEKILKQIHQGGKGVLAKYRELHVGREGFWFFLKYELCMLLFRNVSGLLGLALRGFFYRGLFKTMGKSVAIGTGVMLRNPRRIEVGSRVVLDDGCVLDAKGAESQGIRVGDNVFVSKNAVLSCKDGGIVIGNDVSIGPNSLMHSTERGVIRIGNHVLIAANCYLVGAGNYRYARTDIPMAEQGFEPSQGVVIEDDVWLGAGAMVFDGSAVRKGCIIGAMSMVRGEVPPYAVAYGIPAQVKSFRGKERTSTPNPAGCGTNA